MSRTYSRDDVMTRYEAGDHVPAVNVKVNRWPSDGLGYTAYRIARDNGDDEGTARAFERWAEESPDAQRALDETWWEVACEDGWDRLQSDAEEIFGPGVKVYSTGRSGGWAYLDPRHDGGMGEVDTWDAVKLGKWRRFELWARQIADDVPYQMVQLLYLNSWERVKEARDVAGRAIFTGAGVTA